MASVRAAAVAGMFYPADPRSLNAELDELLGGIDAPAPRLGFPKALVVPHAGYIYSGPIAARAYEELGAARGIVRRVVLLGPVHRVPVRGLAVPTAEAFATPLGHIALDHAALAAARELPQVVASDAAHLQEHALEVQLPFLQRQLGEFALAPFAVGDATVAEVAQVIERLWGGPETLVAIARAAIEAKLFGSAQTIEAPWLAQAGATFVTLTRDGVLRGCIGSLQAQRPLGTDVAENATAAAFRDPRFPAMTTAEWPGVRVEVSLLSAAKPIRFADEEDLLAQLKPGEDGVILEHEGRRATYLPQVWESISDKRQFLRELARKAGLPDDIRLTRCKPSRYRVTKWSE